MLRGRTSRRDISICAFCQHRLSLRLATPRYRSFSSTRILKSDGPGSSGWGSFGAQRANTRPPGSVGGGSWGTPAFAARKIPPAPPTPAPQDSGQSQSEPAAPTPQSPSTSPSTDTKPAEQPPPVSFLSEHEVKAREKLLAEKIALEKAQKAQCPQQHPQSRHMFYPERQLSIEQNLQDEKKDLQNIANLQRKPFAEKPPMYNAVDLGLDKTRSPSLAKLTDSDSFWKRMPARTAGTNGTSLRPPSSRPLEPSSSPNARTPYRGGIGLNTVQQNSTPPRTVGVDGASLRPPSSGPPKPPTPLNALNPPNPPNFRTSSWGGIGLNTVQQSTTPARTVNVDGASSRPLPSEPPKPPTPSEPPKPPTPPNPPNPPNFRTSSWGGIGLNTVQKSTTPARTVNVDGASLRLPPSEPPKPPTPPNPLNVRTSSWGGIGLNTVQQSTAPPRAGGVDGASSRSPPSEPPKLPNPPNPRTSSWGGIGLNTIQQNSIPVRTGSVDSTSSIPSSSEPPTSPWSRLGSNTIRQSTTPARTVGVDGASSKPPPSEPPKPPNAPNPGTSSWGGIGLNTVQQNIKNTGRESRFNTPANPPARGIWPIATNNQGAISSDRDNTVNSTLPEKAKSDEKAGGWGMLARKSNSEISRSDDFWASLTTTNPPKSTSLPKVETARDYNQREQWSNMERRPESQGSMRTNNELSAAPRRPEYPNNKFPVEDKAGLSAPQTPSRKDDWAKVESQTASRGERKRPKPEDDWGREFDSVEYQRTIKPQSATWSAEKPAVQPTPEREALPLQSTGVEPDRMKRFSTGNEPERGSKKRSKRGSRYQQEEYEDEEELSGYQVYQERLRQKEERKAQREAERAGPVPILIPELISITALADALKIGHNDFLSQLGELGFEEVTLDSLMAGETAALVAQEYGFEPTLDTGKDRDLKPRPPPEDPSVLPQRPPVVTIMGHVDHGKTTLLDYLRKSSVAAQEHGGITQHIGAFSVNLSSGKLITFLDTPGHAAFLAMRQRGANVTDIVVLVVAADDSVMPQTVEALNHAQAAKVPIIVAINKIDTDGASISRVKSDLGSRGVEIEDFGGDVQTVCVSGKTGQGMDDLEEAILTLSEILDHRAEVDGQAEGWVLESSLKPVGKVATVLVKRGTLRPGDYIAAGITWAKIRYLRNEAGALVKEAPPGTAVEVMGWKDLPAAGDMVIQSPDEGRAKTAVAYRAGLREREKDAAAQEVIAEARKALQEKRDREKKRKKAEAKGLPEAIEEEEEEEEEEAKGPKIVNFIVKGDVHGSVEAVCAAILEVGNHEVLPRILRSATGPVTESDVEHAATSQSIIVNFATATPGHVRRLAKDQKVQIMDHNIIYRVVEEVVAVLSEKLAPSISSRVLGEAEVLKIFPINTHKRVYKNIAGCRVRNGVIKRNCLYRVLRKNEKIFEGKLESLKQHQVDSSEVNKGSECGIGFEEFQDFKEGDMIQAYEEITTPRMLDMPYQM